MNCCRYNNLLGPRVSQQKSSGRETAEDHDQSMHCPAYVLANMICLTNLRAIKAIPELGR